MGRPKGSLNKVKRAPNKQPRPGGKTGGRTPGTPNKGVHKGRLRPRKARSRYKEGRATWQRLADETDHAFSAFIRWRDLDPSVRDIPSFCTIHYKWLEDEDLSQEMIREFSIKYDWNKRVIAWDADGFKMRIFRQKRAMADMKDKHAQCAKLALEAAMGLLRAVTMDSNNPPRVGEIAALMKVSVDIERVSRDLPTEVTKTTVDGSVNVSQNLSKLSLEELKALKEMKKKVSDE